jgi:hypothetical protein
MESYIWSGIEMFYFTVTLNQWRNLGGGVETGAFSSLFVTSTYSQHT